MAPASTPRQLWVWSLPSLVILLSLVWYKRKRNTLRSDPGGTSKLLPDTAESEHQDIEEEESSPLPLERSESTCEPDSTVDHVKSANIVNLLESDGVAHSEKAVISAVPTLTEATSPVVESSECSNTLLLCPVEETQVVLTSQVVHSSPEEEIKSAEIIQQENSRNELSADNSETVSASDKMKETKEVQPAMATSKDAKNEGDKVSALEGKLASLALGSAEEQRRGAERDSANHSPVDAMLASPSMSSYSDEHSEVSLYI